MRGERISNIQRNWIAGLADIITFTHQGARYGVIHCGVADVARFICPSSLPSVLDMDWQADGTILGPLDVMICGYSGLPFIANTPAGPWINAGVIGIPEQDAASQMRAIGLAHGYEGALLSVYWPSEVFLPMELRVPSLAKG